MPLEGLPLESPLDHDFGGGAWPLESRAALGPLEAGCRGEDGEVMEVLRAAPLGAAAESFLIDGGTFEIKFACCELKSLVSEPTISILLAVNKGQYVSCTA